MEQGERERGRKLWNRGIEGEKEKEGGSNGTGRKRKREEVMEQGDRGRERGRK